MGIKQIIFGAVVFLFLGFIVLDFIRSGERLFLIVSRIINWFRNKK
jgi:hypothetical protein